MKSDKFYNLVGGGVLLLLSAALLGVLSIIFVCAALYDEGALKQSQDMELCHANGMQYTTRSKWYGSACVDHKGNEVSLEFLRYVIKKRGLKKGQQRHED